MATVVMRRAIAVVAVVVVVATASCSWKTGPPSETAPLAESGDATQVTPYFPLANGASWTYEGTVKWTEGTEVSEKEIIWKMEVIETIERYPVVGYALRGYPSDLAWYEEGMEPGNYAVIQTGTSRYYMTDQEALERLKDADDVLVGLVKEYELFLDVPLQVGKVFCEAEQISRVDGSYCWIVDQEEQVELKDIRGIPASGMVPRYILHYSTGPDDQELEFVPGVGITRYSYVHHGTVFEVDVNLVEYQPGE